MKKEILLCSPYLFRKIVEAGDFILTITQGGTDYWSEKWQCMVRTIDDERPLEEFNIKKADYI